jgi:hypothetical protein
MILLLMALRRLLQHSLLRTNAIACFARWLWPPRQPTLVACELFDLASTTNMAIGVATDVAASCISDFPLDVLHRLLLRYLSPRDVVALSAASKRLKQLAEDDQAVWYAICQREFGACTQVEQWVGGNNSSSAPLTYR